MKLLAGALSVATLASSVAAHATWQNLWINGVDYSGSCLRKPNSNSPVSVGTNELNCNFAAAQAPNTCALKAGDTVRVEMHEQPGDRSCAKEAISGKHYGPVMIYLGKVGDARTADPNSVGWFKIAESGLVSNNPDYFGNQVLNNNCGLFQFKIPADIANGDYLLRAETIGLHVAGSAGGAQFYMSCFQLQVSGGGTATPPTVRFPAAYGSSDPGILVDIYRDLTTYVIPGPTPYGTTRAAVATTAWPTAATLPTSNIPATSFTTLPPGAAQPTTTSGTATTTAAPPLQTLYGQCGGQDWTGPTVCQSPYKCVVLSQYYSQCTP